MEPLRKALRRTKRQADPETAVRRPVDTISTEGAERLTFATSHRGFHKIIGQPHHEFWQP